MAPNLPLDTLGWNDSDENSSGEALGFFPQAVPQVPEIFSPHLPQHFQDPDSPNLHLQQQVGTRHPIHPSTKPRTTLRAFVPPQSPSRTNIPSSGGRGLTGGGNTRIVSQEGGAAISQGVQGTFRDPAHLRNLQLSGVTRFHGAGFHAPITNSRDEKAVNFDSIPRTASSNTPHAQESQHPSIVSIPSPSTTESSVPVTSQTRFPELPSDSISQQDTKDAPGDKVVGAATSARPFPAATRPQAVSTTKNPLRIDPGVLKLPGHEPEAPADLVLVHHDRAIDVNNQTGLDGIIVRDDSTSITPEGTSILLMAIPFIYSLTNSSTFIHPRI